MRKATLNGLFDLLLFFFSISIPIYRKKFAPDYVEIPKTTPEELAEQQNEIRNREIKNEFEDGEEIWCLHSDDNKFYIGRLNRTNHEMHPDAPFYVHYVVDITKVSLR